ncbi:hypothetical protein NSS70_01195 [Aeribacillus sp. FSL K6-2848]|nr:MULTISPECIES: hypothetical protein [Aeribacillus]
MRRPSRQRSVCPMAAGLGRSRPAPRMWMSKAKEEVKETTMNMVGKIGDGWEG